MQYIKPVLTFTYKLVVQLLTLLVSLFVVVATAFVESIFSDDESVEKRENDYEFNRRMLNDDAKALDQKSYNYKYGYYED